jgi:hypothetical protein
VYDMRANMPQFGKRTPAAAPPPWLSTWTPARLAAGAIFHAEIVRRVEALFALVDHIEARCTAARAQAQRLTPLVLAKAFRGELAPQDPNDEPASALLAPIASSNTVVAEKNMRKVPLALKKIALAAINL